MTIFEPVGTVQPVFAAFEAVGFVTRSVLGSKRGSAELLDREAAEDDVAEDEVVAVFSSPN
jgi:hypothetical protein